MAQIDAAMIGGGADIKTLRLPVSWHKVLAIPECEFPDREQSCL